MAWREPLFLTNDDGIEAPGLHRLIQMLHRRGHPLAVLAPAEEQSASSMRLSLKNELLNSIPCLDQLYCMKSGL